MLTSERKVLLLDHLKRHGRIIAKQASVSLKLSEDTIRRDLRELAAEGLLLRVHGGALPASPTVVNIRSRRSLSVHEKQRLGRAGAALVAKAKSCFIDGGTTNLELVRALPRDVRTHIFTHSPTIAAALEPCQNARVTVIGGRLFRHSMVAVGAVALQAIRQLRAELFVLGVTGVHREEGFTTGDDEEAAIKRAIMKRAAETITLVTSDKIGTASAHHVADAADISTVVVVRGIRLPRFRGGDVKVVRAV